MKHSRSEIIRCIVNSYIKRRQYYDSDVLKKSDVPIIQNAENAIASAIVDVETSSPNSVMYKCVSNDPVVAESQFSNFKTWINELPCVNSAEELRSLLFPLLCHLYVEMLLGGHRTASANFLKKHQSVSTEEEFVFLEKLAAIESSEELSDEKVLSHLRASKYQVAVSSHAIHLLKQYLAKKAHIILLQIFNDWFDWDEPKPPADALKAISEDITGQANGYQEHTDTDLAKIEEIIRLVNEGPSMPSPLLLYTVQNSDDRLSCGKVSADKSLLVGGYTTCEIRLWSLTEKRLVRKAHCPGTRARLAIDVDYNEANSISYSVGPFGDGKLNDCDSLVLRGHCGTVLDVVIVPSSNFLISVSMDKTMRAWHLDDYKCSAIYKGHIYPIWCVDASPLLGYIATGSHDRTARLWFLERNYPLRIFAGHHQDVDCIKFHPNGNYVATGSSDNSIRLWSTDTGELVRVLDGHRAGVMALAFSPDGNYIASGGDDKKIKVWDLRSSSVTDDFSGHTDTIVSLDWSSDGDFIASCSADHSARIWSMKPSDDDMAAASKQYSILCSNMCSVRYSARNTPICVVGVKT